MKSTLLFITILLFSTWSLFGANLPKIKNAIKFQEAKELVKKTIADYNQKKLAIRCNKYIFDQIFTEDVVDYNPNIDGIITYNWYSHFLLVDENGVPKYNSRINLYEEMEQLIENLDQEEIHYWVYLYLVIGEKYRKFYYAKNLGNHIRTSFLNRDEVQLAGEIFEYFEEKISKSVR